MLSLPSISCVCLSLYPIFISTLNRVICLFDSTFRHESLNETGRSVYTSLTYVLFIHTFRWIFFASSPPYHSLQLQGCIFVGVGEVFWFLSTFMTYIINTFMSVLFCLFCWFRMHGALDAHVVHMYADNNRANTNIERTAQFSLIHGMDSFVVVVVAASEYFDVLAFINTKCRNDDWIFVAHATLSLLLAFHIHLCLSS